MTDALLRLQYDEHDGAGATTALRAVLGSGTVAVGGPALDWRQESLVDDGITLTRLRAQGEADVRIADCPELVLIAVRAGAVRLTVRDRQEDLEAGDLGLVPLGATAQLRWSRLQADVFGIPAAPLGRLLDVRGGDVRLHAPRLRPRSPALAHYVGHAMQLLTDRTFEQAEVYQRDLIRANAIDLLTASVVEAFELVDRSERGTSRDQAVVRRAVAFMRQHLRDPISIPEVATASGVSVRGLQLVFHRQLATTPLLHLRQLRLEAAREDLTQRSDEGTTVAAVASRYGYANPGRFSTHYRDAFDESPAAAIRRLRDPAPDREA